MSVSLHQSRKKRKGGTRNLGSGSGGKRNVFCARRVRDFRRRRTSLSEACFLLAFVLSTVFSSIAHSAPAPPSSPEGAAALPDGFRISSALPARFAFVMENSLWIADPADGSLERIEGEDWTSPGSPTFLSPRGDRILFGAYRRRRYPPHPGTIDISVSNLYEYRNGKVFPLTDRNDLNLSPDFCRATGAIVFVSNRHSHLRKLFPRYNTIELYYREKKWHAARKFTESGGTKFNPRWSPDGTHVLFLWYTPETAGLYLLDTRNGKVRRISETGDYATWSPDGARIAFVHQGEIFVVPVGKNCRTRGTPRLLLGTDRLPGYASFTRWTDYGLLFQWAASGRSGISLYNSKKDLITELVSADAVFGGSDLAPLF
ncbi:MAG: hypothetical protein D6679_11250 [Candidatus Hydrogenedentota bacterium]|nr:MAG: hypothetical protein D6679_11250 [Candidatus Hydrogenedentota bacterium]